MLALLVTGTNPHKFREATMIRQPIAMLILAGGVLAGAVLPQPAKAQGIANVGA